MSVYPLGRNPALWETVITPPAPIYTKPADLNVMSRRLKTFAYWPSTAPDMRQDMAKDGLYYTGVRDIVKCYLCGGQLSGWHRRDNPTVRHRRMSPRCMMVRDPGQTSDQAQYGDIQGPRPQPSAIVTSSSSSSGDTSPPSPGRLQTDGVGFRPKGAAPSSEKCHLKEKHLKSLSAMKNARLLGFCEGDIGKAIKKLTESQRDITNDSLLDELHIIQDESLTLDIEGKRADTAAATQHSKSSELDRERLQQLAIEQEKLRLRSLIAREMCRVCHTARAVTLVLPCAHKVTCEDCTQTLQRCALCDKVIKGTKQVFFA